MAKDIFLYEGAIIRTGDPFSSTDNGRVRHPFSTTDTHSMDSHVVERDSEFPNSRRPNAMTTKLHMSMYPELKGLEVDDKIYTLITPPMALYFGIWGIVHDPYPGMTADIDLVKVTDVFDGWQAGDTSSAASVGDPITLDFAESMGYAACDAMQLMEINGGEFTDYRNPDAVVSAIFGAPEFSGLADALYMRMTITGVPEPDPDAACTPCDGTLPLVQMGALLMETGANTQMLREACACYPAPVCC